MAEYVVRPAPTIVFRSTTAICTSNFKVCQELYNRLTKGNHIACTSVLNSLIKRPDESKWFSFRSFTNIAGCVKLRIKNKEFNTIIIQNHQLDSREYSILMKQLFLKSPPDELAVLRK